MNISSASEITPQPHKHAFGVRIAEIAALKPDGSTVFGQRKIPTLPQFDQIFGAFAQGTQIKTDKGYTAVEDLQPGDRLAIAGGRTETVTWIGSAPFSPDDLGDRMQLTRVTSDSFGVNRPANCISLGSAARVLQTPPDLRGAMGTTQMMTPADRFVDGVGVIRVYPPSTMRLFHVALRRHSAINADGLDVESFHPGNQSLQLLSQTLRTVYLSCFPHITQLSDFGPMSYQRAPEENDQTAA